VFAQVSLSGLNSWVDARLADSGSMLAFVGLLFLGGLIASLLPCVYPLYPITASIIQKRSPGSSRLLHPTAYYSGLLLVYASFGVIAATTSGAFNAVLRLGITNLAISALFVILALSTAGWLHLSLFQGRSVSVRPGLLGTVVLGGAAGMLSSACVGPVVVSILLRLAATGQDSPTALNALAGAGQMVAFGMGVGLPLFCVAVFGLSLPKSGRWMLGVQYILAGVIGYFAYVYLGKGLAILELPESAAPMLFASAVAFLLLAYVIQSEETFFETRVRRALYSLGLVLSAAVIVRTLQHPPSPMLAEVDRSGATSGAPALEQDGNLTWHLDEDAAYEQAQRDGKNVFIDFYGSWCTNCKAFQKLAHSHQDLNAALGKSVLLKVSDRVPLYQKYKEDPRFPELKIGLPFFVITDPKRHLLYKTNDYQGTDDMLLFLNE
jgi:thiol:disulfide interchange protein DsbD